MSKPTKQTFDFARNLQIEIRKFLYETAYKSGKYDCLRFEMPLSEVVDKAQLDHLDVEGEDF